MILSVFRKKPDARAVKKVYASIVAQSRQKNFYAHWNVPDSVNGRFDMISLHLCLLLRRLKTSEKSEREFSQSVFDLFFKDMDRSLREMGAGDMAVPKRIQKMGELFYGMLASITDALDNDDGAALRQALVRNIYDGEEPSGLDNMTQYVLRMVDHLNGLELDTILAGDLDLQIPQ